MLKALGVLLGLKGMEFNIRGLDMQYHSEGGRRSLDCVGGSERGEIAPAHSAGDGLPGASAGPYQAVPSAISSAAATTARRSDRDRRELWVFAGFIRIPLGNVPPSAGDSSVG